MKKVQRGKILIISILLSLIFIIVLLFTNIDNKEPIYIEWQTDASQAKHYEITDKITIKKHEFKILKYSKMEDNNGWIITLDGKSNIYDFLNSGYSFSLGYNDEMFLDIGCNYTNKQIQLIYMYKCRFDKFNQVIIYDNKSLKIIAVININEELKK
ncbi:hypothetical protein EGW03_02615 [bacterium]|nr:hypothetical protein [bacterium]